MATFREGIVPYAAILGVIAALMAKEPHFSGMVLLLGIGAVMMYVGGIRNYWVGLGFALVLLVIYAFATGHHHLQLEPNRHLARPVQRRVDAR